MDKTFYENLEESGQVELKEASDRLPSSIYETYSAFANTAGGTIYLGIREHKKKPNEITGVTNPDRLKMNFANTVANKDKVSVDLLGPDDIAIDEVDGKKVVVIRVRQAPTHLRPVYLNGNPYEAFRRNGIGGDTRVGQYKVLSMLNDANKTRYDAQANTTGARLEDLCPSTLRSFRNRYHALYENAESGQDDEAFLRRVGALKRNEEGEYVPTNACLALLGYANSIREVFPHYKVDFYDKTTGEGRYDYRLDDGDISWSGNLYDFLFLVCSHIASTLPNPFHLSGLSNAGSSEGENALREGLLNAIFNCDFFSPGGIRVIQEGTRISIENQGRMIVPLSQALIGGDSQPRNEGIAILMRAVGLGERSGYGVPAIFEYFKKANLFEPEIKETYFPTDKTTLTLLYRRYRPLEKEEEEIYRLIKDNGPLGAAEIAKRLGKSRSYVSPFLASMIQQGILLALGSATNGRKYDLANRLDASSDER